MASRKKTEQTYTQSAEELETILDEIESDLILEPTPITWPVGESTTFDGVIDRRFEPVLAPGTMGIYRAALRAWRIHFGKRDGHPAVRLDKLTPAMWLDYRAWRANTRNSSSTPRGSTTPRPTAPPRPVRTMRPMPASF